MPIGYLAVHLSMLPNWVNIILEKDELDIGLMMKSGWKMPDFESADASVAVFDDIIGQDFMVPQPTSRCSARVWRGVPHQIKRRALFV